MKRSSPGPWYGDERRRLIFESRARAFFSGLHGRPNPGGREGWGYALTLDVTGDEPRAVVIAFRNGSEVPRVWADGPDESPHRFTDDGSLCMWHPGDPPEMRWMFRSGLHALLALIASHLFKEAWWREYDQWLGPQVSHAPGLKYRDGDEPQP